MPIIWDAFFIGCTGSGFSLPRASFIGCPIFIGYCQLVSDQSPIKIQHVWNLHYKISGDVTAYTWSYILCSYYYNHDWKWIIAFNGIIRSGSACIHKFVWFLMVWWKITVLSFFLQFFCGAKIEGGTDYIKYLSLAKRRDLPLIWTC